MTINQTKAIKSYFRGDARFGRTTTLVEASTGRALIECMGICTRRQLWDAYQRELTR